MKLKIIGNTYNYSDLSAIVEDNEMVTFTVEFISDGNKGTTTVICSPTHKVPITDANSGDLDLAKNLRGGIVSSSSIFNAVPEEDEIRIKYKINGKEILEHVNKKDNTSNPTIILIIKFPKQ